MGNVMVIPARRQVGNTVKQSAQKKLRVAAYCRVSTDSEEQETSYEAQVTHYTRPLKKCKSRVWRAYLQTTVSPGHQHKKAR